MSIYDLLHWQDGAIELLKNSLFGSFVSVLLVILGWIFRFLYEQYSFHYKMRSEYYFKQKVQIKEKLAQTKTPLIYACEQLKYRLLNMTYPHPKAVYYIDEWAWKKNEAWYYYYKSFTYRFLVFVHYLNEAEKSVYSFDLKQADQVDENYLKQINVLRNFFCAPPSLAKESIFQDGYHGYIKPLFNRSELDHFSKLILNQDGSIMDFDTYCQMITDDYQKIKKLVDFFANANPLKNTYEYNILLAFQLFLIQFLNDYGIAFHKTSEIDFKRLIQTKYTDFTLKDQLLCFIRRNKIENQSYFIVRQLYSECEKNAPDCSK